MCPRGQVGSEEEEDGENKESFGSFLASAFCSLSLPAVILCSSSNIVSATCSALADFITFSSGSFAAAKCSAFIFLCAVFSWVPCFSLSVVFGEMLVLFGAGGIYC